MGLELLERPVFKDSVARSSKILKTLGCEWDPVAELEKGKGESRLGKSRNLTAHLHGFTNSIG